MSLKYEPASEPLHISVFEGLGLYLEQEGDEEDRQWGPRDSDSLARGSNGSNADANGSNDAGGERGAI